MSLTPEGKVKRQISKLLKDKGVWYFMPPANGYGRKGIPDYMASANGYLVGVEAKADATKKPTALQIRCGEEMIASGAHWMVVCDDRTLGILEELLCSLLNRPKP